MEPACRLRRTPDEADAFRGGWFHSGDLGTLSEDRYLSIVDRKKDMIKTGGENVASSKVEEAIYQLDDSPAVVSDGQATAARLRGRRHHSRPGQ